MRGSSPTPPKRASPYVERVTPRARLLSALPLLFAVYLAGCPSDVVPPATLDFDGDGVADADDCAPEDPRSAPGLPEICDGVDNDCDGAAPDEQDADMDGARVCAGDCDDNDRSRSPEIVERCDGIDNDCDEEVPDDEVDADTDGWRECEGDCDDVDGRVHPQAPDTCGDGVDADCEGDLWREQDVDGDGFMPCDGDCDDLRADVFPGRVEACDGVDSDCSGIGDERDADGDGAFACSGECDDTNPDVHPGAPEICDGLDNDCDGAVLPDETDDDGDGHFLCGPPALADCDDQDPTRYYGAPEVCDGLINDCAGTEIAVDELDLDFDGSIPCQGDDDLLAPVAAVQCTDCVDGPFPGAPTVTDAVPAVEWAALFATATYDEHADLLTAVTAEMDAARGLPGTAEPAGFALDWPAFPLEDEPCGGGNGVPWDMTADHAFAIADGTAAGSPSLVGWYHAVSGDAGWNFCFTTGGEVMDQTLVGLVSDGAQVLAADGTVAAALDGFGYSAIDFVYLPYGVFTSYPWGNVTESWDVDLEVGTGAGGSLLPAGVVSIDSEGERSHLWSSFFDGATQNIVTYHSWYGAWSGSVVAHPDTPWEMSWSLTQPLNCATEAEGTVDVVVRPSPAAPPLYTASIAFDGASNCDSCGEVVLDGSVAGLWCPGAGFTPTP